MMAAFRTFAKSPWAAALMGLLIISFGIWGVRDVFHTRISDAVITAGSRQVSSAEFKKAFDRQLADAQQQSGQTVSAQDAADQGLVGQLLRQMASQEAVMEVIRGVGVKASDALVVAEMRKIPVFFNQVTGTFDQKDYEEALAQQKFTPDEFLKDLHDQLAMEHFITGMAAGLKTPLTYTTLLTSLAAQNRDADYFLLDQKSVPAPAKPTDQELEKFIRDNAAQLKRPEMRVVSLVRFSAQNLAQTLPADPAEVQRIFDSQKSSLSTPEKRSFVQIPAKDEAQAAAMAARLSKGEDATAVARSMGAKPISYADVAKGSVADSGVADIVFGLVPGQTSGPIKGQFGYAVVKLAGVTPGKPATLEDVRAKIETQVKERDAQNKSYDQVQKYEDAHAAGQPMSAAAKAAGVQVYQIGPITADGRDLTGQPASGMNQRMVTDVFSLPQGGEGDVVDLGKGEYYAVRAEKVVPSAVPGLEEIRAQLTNYYMRQELVKSLQAKAEQLIQRLHKGESVAAVGASAGATLQHVAGVSRTTASQQQALGQDFLSKLFQAKTGDTFSALTNNGLAVARVSAIRPGTVGEIARSALQVRAQVDNEMQQNELTEMVSTAARIKVKPTVDEGRARQALGVTAAQPAAKAGKPLAPAP